jgi:hypothetical protein
MMNFLSLLFALFGGIRGDEFGYACLLLGRFRIAWAGNPAESKASVNTSISSFQLPLGCLKN